MKLPSPKRHHPLPEAIDGKAWRIEGSAGRASVELTQRTMIVPLSGDDQSLFLRAHEQAHVAITPPVNPIVVTIREGVGMDALQVCEDARVHWFLERARVDRPGGLTSEEVATISNRIAGDPRAIGAALVSTEGTGDYARILNALAVAVESPGGIGGRGLVYVADMARDVVRRVRSVKSVRTHHPAESPRGFAKNTIPAAKLFETYFGSGGLAGDPREDTPDDDALRRRFDRLPQDDNVRWGKLDAVAALPMKHPRPAGKRSGRGSTFRDEGANPNALHRFATDGRIFRRWRPAPGGTVLVDVSGSMHLDADDVEAIVRAAPAATVAMYSGRRSSGKVWIVARNGKVASDREIDRARGRTGGGNIIDGPALRWLNECPAPRLWVSDGAVTGCGDRQSRQLVAEAYALCRRGSVRRVDRADQVSGIIAAINKR